ncbi:serine/threonine-protein kinase [Mycobacterium sp. Aquia_213]|uniref:serine/threonine-protein kinase n=1 Tax=Mycobacterium sp. Aquia_213 TaxID=2991728 RepID=UPI00226F02A4|nr:serine/threonine-protein kinase [Mycobacterium sp. Aquia_213]WAC93563.1 serine/threonine-protein kinase [Mycobacterium sp. Aquia_213]
MDGTPFGRYRLTELLGRGGMGEVWRAYDPEMNRVVALKVLVPSFANDQAFQERFRREARSAARLDEPHVVPIYDFGEVDGRLYVTMRLIRGRDLRDLLNDGPLPPARAVGIIEQIASALHAAHEIGLVHRDVKPSNILVAEDDFAYLIDFGIARAAGESSMTVTGATMGTAAYMSPERLNAGHADARADIYALACVLHEALTGQRPYPGESLEQQLVGHLTSPPPRPSALQPGVPEAMDAVVATGMAKDPDQRYATAKDLAHAARAALTTSGPREAASPQTSADAGSKLVLTAVGLLAVAAVVVVIVIGTTSSSGGGVASSSRVSPARGTGTAPAGNPVSRLLAMVPNSEGCVPVAPAHPGSLAAVHCPTAISGNGYLELVYHLFPDQATQNSAFNNLNFVPCPGAASSPQPWQRPSAQHTEGQVGCLVSDGFEVIWTIQSQLVTGDARGQPPNASLDNVYQWWAAQYQ